MNVARLNFSHGTHEEHGRVILSIRDISKELCCPTAILQDVSGPKVRVGMIHDGPVYLESNQIFILTSRDIIGNCKEVSLTYKGLVSDVKSGDKLLLADGTIKMVVEEVKGQDVYCRVIIGGYLNSHKGINLPDKTMNIPILSKKDINDIRFGIENKVDYIALSFVRNLNDVLQAREIIENFNGNIPIIAKIEKHEALNEIDGIIANTNGIMIARGDLGVDIPIEKVPIVQKNLIQKANNNGKPVITATQMLRSMVDNPLPSRSEVTDIANAVLDGSDALMLSEETAIGKYPFLAVETMSKSISYAETLFPYKTFSEKYIHDSHYSIQEAVAATACQIANRLEVKAIVAYTQSGSTARLISKYRPSQTIFGLTPEINTFRMLSLNWGVYPILVSGRAQNEDDMEKEAIELVKQFGKLVSGDRVLVVVGLPLYVSGTTNALKVSVI
jgi:pyruvate kinase